jgi:hypothetical protein
LRLAEATGGSPASPAPNHDARPAGNGNSSAANATGTNSPHRNHSSAFSMDTGSAISESWHRLAVFDTRPEFNEYLKSHPQGLTSGKNRKAENGCVLPASSATTDLQCLALCRYVGWKCKRCCDPNDAKVNPTTGKKNYTQVVPKCGIIYREGRFVKAGTMSHSGAGRSLSTSSGTEAMQNAYELVGGVIVLERRRIKGFSGNHVSINPTSEMFGVITPPNSHIVPQIDTLYPKLTHCTPELHIVPPNYRLYTRITDYTPESQIIPLNYRLYP